MIAVGRNSDLTNSQFRSARRRCNLFSTRSWSPILGPLSLRGRSMIATDHAGSNFTGAAARDSERVPSGPCPAPPRRIVVRRITVLLPLLLLHTASAHALTLLTEAKHGVFRHDPATGTGSAQISVGRDRALVALEDPTVCPSSA